MFKCTFEIGCILTCLIFVLFLFVEFVAILTDSHLLGLLIIIFVIYLLLKYVGLFALYPGCFAYIKSDIEIRGSFKMAQNIS